MIDKSCIPGILNRLFLTFLLKRIFPVCHKESSMRRPTRQNVHLRLMQLRHLRLEPDSRSAEEETTQDALEEETERLIRSLLDRGRQHVRVRTPLYPEPSSHSGKRARRARRRDQRMNRRRGIPRLALWQAGAAYEYEIAGSSRYTGWVRCREGRLADGRFPESNMYTGEHRYS